MGHLHVSSCDQESNNCLFVLLYPLVVSLTRRGGRGLWDTFMFQAVIKSRARVPAHDSFIAKRIAGPGLASNYFLQVRFITRGTVFCP